MIGFFIALFAAFLVLAYSRAPAWLWTAGTAFFLAWLALSGGFSTTARIALAVVFIVVALALNRGSLMIQLAVYSLFLWSQPWPRPSTLSTARARRF